MYLMCAVLGLTLGPWGLRLWGLGLAAKVYGVQVT